MDLSPVQLRVLGSLIEKQLTTPQYYPLTLRALVSACNQSNNRDPVTALDDRTVELALDNLKERGLVRFVHATQGARTMKYRQVIDESLALSSEERAVLCVLLLRGPQTLGELRTRTERMHAFGSLGDVEQTIGRLADREPPLAARLGRAPGQKEDRYTHLLGSDVPALPGAAPEPPAGPGGSGRRRGVHRPQEPRIRPVADDEIDPERAELLASLGDRAAGMNIFRTLVRHPGLFRKWSPFGGKLLAGKLAPRDRELLILRTAYNTASSYEWGQHVRIGLDAGLVDDEIQRIVLGPDADGWSAFESALLRAADELHAEACVADGTWSALAARYDERQLIELVMLVGHYTMVAYTLNSLGVQREHGVPAFPPEET